MYEDEKKSYNNSGYGQNSNYSGYSYENNSSSYNSNPYSQGQSSYGYGSNSQGYGTYQYSTNQNANNQPPQPPKKKKKVGAIVAIVLIVMLLLGGAGFAAFRIFNGLGLPGGSQQSVAQIEEKEDQSATENSAAGTQEEKTDDQKVQTTTTTAGETRVVVTDVTGVVEEVMPAMVMIHNNFTQSANFFGYVQQEEAQASGSGIIVGHNDTELLIATNYHVIDGADSLEVIFNDDTSVGAAVKGTNSDMDLAVIAIMLDEIPENTLNAIKEAKLGDSNTLKLGEPAIAIGNALGYGQSVTTGVISALNREVETQQGGDKHTFIQTDAAINPGNSGGALLNLNGEVIGINSNKLGGNVIEGMGYAIPISDAKPIIDQLMNEETKIKVAEEERGYIGIQGYSVPSDVTESFGIPQGAYVDKITPGGGAEAAGLVKGDVIVKFEGHDITSMDDLQTRLQYYKAGTTVKLGIMRTDGSEYKETEVELTLGKAPSSDDSKAASNEKDDASSEGSSDN
ncbi:PDZ domain-containing protein [Butyrivibrio sp. XB500-5]|uniref:S1C family serine protease n=1 Tax=Butyrivibrio sp. XB500-5 TaxID=2364880 RepID=UPI000EA936E5|nr:trypsin-like peptidase domain-containing protein [Butyrivibrio sp. XB500-5]RKM57694.1 PDZ domain-containing protein [Butyrivibrio sp. XB500-5]